ncbi:MAG: aminoacyl-histidine dipeptidase [Breznakibacter sp.]
MNVLSKLSPALVWKYFEEITKIPRPSKQEAKIIAYLEDFAQRHHLKYKKDAIGNVLITKGATPGYENCKTVVLQSHMDMVCEKNSDKMHDFTTDPITVVVDGAWVKADNTTLGADDGIGMAAQLAVLVDTTIEHGPVECLFTVDEETGLSGAFALKEGFLSGSVLLNLDSEDEGEIFIGCAGGVDTLAEFDIEEQDTASNVLGIKIRVSGLTGGHSGDDIHKGLGNANKILARFIRMAMDEVEFSLSEIDGGNLRNAIAREAYAIGTVPLRFKEEIRVLFNHFSADIQNELKTTEPGLRMFLESYDLPTKQFTDEFVNRFVFALLACPHGVLDMSRDIPGLVETSTNLASIKRHGDVLVVTTSQRSSVESAKEYAAQMVESVFVLAGAHVHHSDGYPGWTPNVNSAVLAIAKESYWSLFGKQPVVRAIHAGLECGLFLEKAPGLDMISFGPTIRGAHSPQERIEIESVQKFWDLLIDILKRVPRA